MSNTQPASKRFLIYLSMEINWISCNSNPPPQKNNQKLKRQCRRLISVSILARAAAIKEKNITSRRTILHADEKKQAESRRAGLGKKTEEGRKVDVGIKLHASGTGRQREGEEHSEC